MNNDSYLIWRSACLTDTGKVRAINEDACLDLPELGLWVVADGMGGHEAGDVASRMIIEHFRQISEPDNLNNFVSAAKRCLLEVNQSLREIAAQQYSNATIGSTMVALLAYGKQCAYLWVGDSRIYRLRNEKLEQMTKDHSMVEKYIDEGLMRPEEAYDSSVANVLTRAVGAQDTLDIDLKLDELQDGDTFLLCSDGLYREVSHEEIAQLMTRGDDCTTITKNLLERALDKDAKDNVTVSVVRIKDAYS
jgi:serine/threonine protein phosphatase PrpC